MKKAFVAISAKARERLQGRADESICNFIKFLIAQTRNIGVIDTSVLWVFSSTPGRQRHQGEFPVPSWLCTTFSHHLFNTTWCCVPGVQSTEGTTELSSGLDRDPKSLQKATKNAKMLEINSTLIGRGKSHYFTISKTHSSIRQMEKCFVRYTVQYIACITGLHSCMIPRHFLGAGAFTFIRLLTEKDYSC